MTKSQVEQELENMNINVENVKELYKDNVQKIIPKDWYFPIIEKCIDLCDIAPETVNFNKQDRIVTIVFENESITEGFENKFHSNLFKAVNDFIKSKDENPKVYNRVLIFETGQEGISFRINY